MYLQLLTTGEVLVPTANNLSGEVMGGWLDPQGGPPTTGEALAPQPNKLSGEDMGGWLNPHGGPFTRREALVPPANKLSGEGVGGWMDPQGGPYTSHHWFLHLIYGPIRVWMNDGWMDPQSLRTMEVLVPSSNRVVDEWIFHLSHLLRFWSLHW